METLLEVRNLRTEYHTKRGTLCALNGVDFDVRKGEAVALVGEDGCGKSTTAFSIMRLVDPRQGAISAGEVLFRGEDLLKKSEEEMRRIRGKDISMVFQNPMTSLDPVFTVGQQLIETYMTHLKISRREARRLTVEVLSRVGIPYPQERLNDLPHHFSGGMRQRVVIAIALACNPSLLIADEPTTALDVTIQLQVIELLKELMREGQNSMILISNSLGIVSGICQRVAVMYAGQVVEFAPTPDLYEKTLHPYTQGLYRSLPDNNVGERRLRAIPGNLPDMLSQQKGCWFAPRCEFVMDRCRVEEPALLEVETGHRVRCHLYP